MESLVDLYKCLYCSFYFVVLIIILVLNVLSLHLLVLEETNEERINGKEGGREGVSCLPVEFTEPE